MERKDRCRSPIRRLLTPLAVALSRRRRAGDPPRPGRRREAGLDGCPAATTARPKADTSRRVPNHFGQVGLTPAQRESIYKIRKAHQEKIDALKAQIVEADGSR